MPDGEADAYARFSLLGLLDEIVDPLAHGAHLIVAFTPAVGTSAFDQIRAFARILASVSKASEAVGIYWNAAQATHPADSFFGRALMDDASPLLWTGASQAVTPDGQLSLLSLGLGQLDLPNLLLSAPRAQDAVEAFVAFVSYVAQRGAAIADGGRSAQLRMSDWWFGTTDHRSMRRRLCGACPSAMPCRRADDDAGDSGSAGQDGSAHPRTAT